MTEVSDTTQSDRQLKEVKFKQGILISFVVHIVIVAAFFIEVTFFKKTELDLSQAIRVDMVGLPDKAKSNALPEKIQNILKAKETPAPKIEEPADEPKVIEKKAALPDKAAKIDTEAINLKKAKTTQKNALAKLKTMSAIERLKQEMQNDDVKKPAASANVVVKGRVISAGTALSGLDKVQADGYLQVLDAHIKQYWALPQWLMNRSYKARVLVKFDMNGKIISKQIAQTSGQKAYDDYCLLALEQAEPFPKFLEKFSEKYKTDGVLIGFPE